MPATTTDVDVNTFTFGIELETTIPAGQCSVGSYPVGDDVPWLPLGWKAKHDGSIRARNGRVGCEFVSPILRGADGIRQVLEAVAAINAHGGAVNQSCGCHVHVGWTDGPAVLKRLVTLVANFERAIYASTGTRRREIGSWCRGLQGYGNADNAEQTSRHARYHVLNLTNLRPGGKQTVEFRAFSGTLNILKIIGYIRLCLGMVERARRVSRATNFTPKVCAEKSPVRRKSGEGATQLTRLFYQLGWIKGRTTHTHGNVDTDGAPTINDVKRELMRLARKYDHGE